MKIFKNARWLRINEIFNKEFDNLSLFDVIDPNSIRQGNLSVCYLGIINIIFEIKKKNEKKNSEYPSCTG